MTNESSKLSLNIILHVVILFAILSSLFILYISKITTKFINKEITEIIKHSITNILYDKDNKPVTPSLSLTGMNDNMINMYTTVIFQKIKDMINNDSIIQNLKAENSSLVNQLNNLTKGIDTDLIAMAQSNIVNIKSKIDTQINNIINNFPYDYYIKIFSQEEKSRQTYNQDLFTNIKIVNLLLIIFLIFFIFISLKTGTLNISDVLGIFGENLLTFFFVGIIELWFFLNVASKFIPSPPSLLFKSLFKSITNILDTNIIPRK